MTAESIIPNVNFVIRGHDNPVRAAQAVLASAKRKIDVASFDDAARRSGLAVYGGFPVDSKDALMRLCDLGNFDLIDRFGVIFAEPRINRPSPPTH